MFRLCSLTLVLSSVVLNCIPGMLLHTDSSALAGTLCDGDFSKRWSQPKKNTFNTVTEVAAENLSHSVENQSKKSHFCNELLLLEN